MLLDCFRGASFPITWSSVVAVLIPKKEHAPTRIGKLRDIWLTSIGSRIVGMFTRDSVVNPIDKRLLFAQAGFRRARQTLEHCQSLLLMTQLARKLHIDIYCLWVDLDKCFMTFPREAGCAVPRRRWCRL